MKMNIIIIYNKEESHLLMCLRSKEPYKGLYNFVGGKVECHENSLKCAYRELFEETGITKNDCSLTRIMDLKYYMSDIELQVYAGKLNKEVNLVEEKNKLYWISIKDNFFDMKKYAGEGNIGHILEQIRIHRNKALITDKETIMI